MKKNQRLFFLEKAYPIFVVPKNNTKAGMFNFGIFSTHLPYIAFVSFYAFFFLFGLSKSNAEKFDTKSPVFKSSTYVTQHIYFSGDHDHNENQDLHFYFYHSFNSDLPPPTPSGFFGFHLQKIKQSHLCFNLFSRPPPVV